MPFNNLQFVKIHTELRKEVWIYRKDALRYINIPKWLQNVKECILQKDRLCSWDITIKQQHETITLATHPFYLQNIQTFKKAINIRRIFKVLATDKQKSRLTLENFYKLILLTEAVILKLEEVAILLYK